MSDTSVCLHRDHSLFFFDSESDRSAACLKLAAHTIICTAKVCHFEVKPFCKGHISLLPSAWKLLLRHKILLARFHTMRAAIQISCKAYRGRDIPI